jgi:uroporphyrin-III C-methyltransferase
MTDSAATPVLSEPPKDSRRVHSYSRLTTAIAVLALATGVYTLLRLDSTRDRVDAIKDTARALQSENDQLRTQVAEAAAREQQTLADLRRRTETMSSVPQQIEQLNAEVDELRGRTQGPERAWSRAEALFLLQLAQRRLELDRDVQTAIVAVESADTRLAALRSDAFAAVRRQIARDLQALRAVREPDITSILARLSTLEERTQQLPVKGIVAQERSTANRREVSTGMFARAWALLRNAFTSLIVTRRVDLAQGTVLTKQEALLRREHLQLLLLSARTAASRHDALNYRASLSAAEQWMREFFDDSSPVTLSAQSELKALAGLDVDPPLPTIDAAETLRQMSVAGSVERTQP